MGTIHHPLPVLRIIAAFSRYPQALDWLESTAVARWGTLAKVSPRFAFRETEYYRTSMGDDLFKMFVAFADPIDPAGLAEWKLSTNAWEEEYAAQGRHPEPRPLNLDPGYITEGKLVLASTKDHAHRIYLSNGIYAEITLRYSGKRWQSQPWTYPDYQREDFQSFFDTCRNYLRSQKTVS